MVKPQQQPTDNGALRYNAGPGQDPSALTTQQLLRENFWLREFLEVRINGVEERIIQSDKAVSLLQAFADRTPTTKDVQAEVTALREVTTEKFSSVAERFTSGGTALAAALQAQEKQAIATNDSTKTANSKMEDNFTKLIEQGRELLQANKTSMETQINDIKSRLDKGEGRSGGIDKTWGVVVVAATLIIAGTVAFVAVTRAPSNSTVPQMIYLPSPAAPLPPVGAR